MSLLYRISLKALIYNDAGQILIEYGKMSSKDELTKKTLGRLSKISVARRLAYLFLRRIIITI